MVGNLLGDPLQIVSIGATVSGVFEHHSDSAPLYSLMQLRTSWSVDQQDLLNQPSGAANHAPPCEFQGVTPLPHDTTHRDLSPEGSGNL